MFKKNNVKSEEKTQQEEKAMNETMGTVKSDINDIKQDINDIKNADKVVIKEYHDHKISFWGWLAISSVASAVAGATVSIVKCLHGGNSDDAE